MRMTGRDGTGTATRRGGIPTEAIAAGALSLAALFWSGNFIVGRALRDEVDPVTLNTLRCLLCLLLFLPLVGRRLLRHRAVLRREWRLLLALGTSGIAGYQTMAYLALSHTTAVNAVLMLALTPGIILLGAAMLGRSRPTGLQWLGSLVSLLGAAVLITRLDPALLDGLRFNPGDLWMVGAVLCWAAYSLILQRRPADLPQDVTLAASIALAGLLLVPLALIVEPGIAVEPTLPVIGGLLYLALFASLFAYLLWSYGVTAIGPERSGQFVHLIPVFGLVLAPVLLEEAIVLPQVAGAACILVGIVLVNRIAPPPR